MSKIMIAGDTSGTVTLESPAVAGNTVLTLPTTSGTVLTTSSSEAKETFYMLAAADNGTASRSVFLSAGTWQIVLQDGGGRDDGGYDITVTRNATVGTTTVTTSWRLYRTGGSGFGRRIHGLDNAVGTLVVTSDATVTMSIAAPVQTGGTMSVYSGAILTASKIS